MLKFLVVLLVVNLQMSVGMADEVKPIEKYLTTKDVDVKKVTVRKA